jgi:hypothetical protein
MLLAHVEVGEFNEGNFIALLPFKKINYLVLPKEFSLFGVVIDRLSL